MSESLNIFDFKPTIATGLGFETIPEYRQVREGLGDALRERAQHYATELKTPWKFLKRFDSDGHMAAFANAGGNVASVVDVGPDSLLATGTGASNLDFFTKIVAPVFDEMLVRVQRTNIHLLGIMFDFSLIVKEKDAPAQLLNAWPFQQQLERFPDYDSVAKLDRYSVAATYVNNVPLVRRFLATLRLTGSQRISFSMDTRNEAIRTRPSSSEIAVFYEAACDYVTSLVTGPLAGVFSISKPED
jgi:hypothetical protein